MRAAGFALVAVAIAVTVMAMAARPDSHVQDLAASIALLLGLAGTLLVVAYS